MNNSGQSGLDNTTRLLEKHEIQEIYDLVLKNNTYEYQMRYRKIITEIEKWNWIDSEVPRVIAVQEFERYVKKYSGYRV